MNDLGSSPAGQYENIVDGTIPQDAFLVIEGGSTVALNKPVVTIGRKQGNEIVLDDPRVSRYHAKICLIKGHFVLFDLNSSGGTFVNNKRIDQGILYPGDVISFGGYNLAFMQGSVLASRGNAVLPPVGPGERNTVVFNTNMFHNEKR